MLTVIYMRHVGSAGRQQAATWAICQLFLLAPETAAAHSLRLQAGAITLLRPRIL